MRLQDTGWGVQDVEEMEVEFGDDDLDRLEIDPKETLGFAQAVVRGYRKVMQQIRAAADERDFYEMRSLHFEKLQGARSHQRSMRLNKQWRLIVEYVERNGRRTIRVVAIEDYH
ncbi:MAG: type II toxin-antitoxin system RelE/ParE family toxin [Phenylobacterium sp.]|uniref:type II toxin-antitoxin system RelE/ParE family toxin n=1 Tax=Phenylobacterium sp. TaxID=1871053 RepID=UPI0027373633|nr:type II toxin-antitoxin system RelE/ParE family toxin [Phenylobacterium sp.]MDP3174906.1 type II toxin-antitoxin system RelE/ParE family toxin [Phenylobacterium sp.]